MAQNQQLTGFIIREIDLAHLVANGENLETVAALLATCNLATVLSLGLNVDISDISHSLLRRLQIGNLIIGTVCDGNQNVGRYRYFFRY